MSAIVWFTANDYFKLWEDNDELILPWYIQEIQCFIGQQLWQELKEQVSITSQHQQLYTDHGFSTLQQNEPE